MYHDHFGFHKSPFSIAPDPYNLFMSLQHRDALAHLLFGAAGGGGFVLLTGEIGTGKTTLCRCLLEQLPKTCDVAFIFNPKLTALELLAAICDELHIEVSGSTESTKKLVDRINHHLLTSHAAGRNTILIIDEAQNLTADVLEQMRLLTNLETNERKLLQIILLGQPELRQKLAQPELAQLAQRIIARFHLGPLTKKDLSAYISHRIRFAGSQRKIIPARLVPVIYRATRGVPRLVNLLCDRALLGAYVEGKDQVDRKVLDKATREIRGEDRSERSNLLLRVTLAISAILVFGAVISLAFKPEVLNRQIDRLASSRQSSNKTAVTITNKLPTIEVVRSEGDLKPNAGEHPRSDISAWSALFDRWGVGYQPGSQTSACEQAVAVGLHCLSGNGSLADLKALNQPALLSLKTKKNTLQVTLSALSDTTATLVSHEGVVTRDVTEVVSEWTGDYTVLWRVPPDYSGALERGDRGASVLWLRRQLVQLGRLPPTSQFKPVFDNALMQQVQRFQKEQNVNPDGLVGPYTAIRLMAALDSRIPQLVSTKKDN